MQVITNNKPPVIEPDNPRSARTKVSTVTDDVNTESYQTSGQILFE